MPNPIRFALTASLLMAAGCASTPESGIDLAIRSYDMGDYQSAFSRATMLDTPEGRYLAGVSALRLGNYHAAERHLESVRTDPTVGPRARESLDILDRLMGTPSGRASATDSGGWALQIGAFSERRRAEAAARAADRPSIDTRIVERQDPRRGRLHVVEIGAFESRRDAAAYRNRSGQSDWIVVSRGSR